MALTLQLADNASLLDYPFHNYSGSDIPAGIAVKLDGAHVISSSNQTQQGIGVIPAASDADTCIGVTRSVIPTGSYGAVRCPGPISVMTADGVITAGGFVIASGGSSKKGFAKASSAGQVTIGVALTTAADADQVAVMLGLAKNA